MISNKKFFGKRKEEPRIILSSVILCTLLCVVFSLLVDRMIVSYILSDTERNLSRLYIRQYLELTEKLLDGEQIERTTTEFYETSQDVQNLLYSTANDKTENYRQIIGSIGASGYTFPLYSNCVSVWIADRNSKEQIERSDYLVVREDNKRFLTDIKACFSDEAIENICAIYNQESQYPVYMENVITYEINYPYVEKYILQNDIVYPLVISFHETDKENIVFYSDIPLEYDNSEIIESDECILYDEMINPGNADYLQAQNLSRQSFRRFSENNTIPHDYATNTQRGYITNVTVVTTDRHIVCQSGIINYTTLLNGITRAGCMLIILTGMITALVRCRKAKCRRERDEYEKSVTNALAHNYKTSLMIIRSCAENILTGVSDEKKSQYEQKIMTETDRMSESTEKILSFYRSGTADFKPSCDRIDASAVCRELISKFDNISAERKLKWSIDDTEDFIFEGDAVLFAMAIDNLIGNAVKYALPDSTISIRTWSDGMIFENSWKPIEKFIKKPRRFFETFVTGDDTPGRSNSGLGLSVAKDLLERMNLKIKAKPNSEKVSFTIKRN